MCKQDYNNKPIIK